MSEIDERALEAEPTTVLDEQLREVGFTDIARDFPRDEVGLRAIAAWIGCTVEQLPVGAHYYPNGATKAAWERVYAAILAYEQHRGKQEPVGFVSNCGIGQLEREGWVAISRTPVKTTDIGLYASPQPADVGALRDEDHIEAVVKIVERQGGRGHKNTVAMLRALATSGDVE